MNENIGSLFDSPSEIVNLHKSGLDGLILFNNTCVF